MKYLKLAVIFIVLLGGIILVLSINNGGDDGVGVSRESIYVRYSREIKEGWANQTDWDKDMFIDYCNKIDALAQDYSVSTLREFNLTKAIEIVDTKIFEEWAKNDCSKPKVDKYRKAITDICAKDNTAKDNSMVQEILAIYDVYKTAYNYAYSDFVPETNFDGNTWRRYSDYRSATEDDIANTLNNSYYRRHLANITAINNGLRNNASRFESGKNTYYEKLAKEIIAHYDRIPVDERNDSDLTKLRTVRNKYNEEYSNNEALNNYSRRYALQVQQNNEREEAEAQAQAQAEAQELMTTN